MSEPESLPLHPLPPFAALWSLIRATPRYRLIALLAFMTLTSLTEGFGIFMLVPLLESLGDVSGRSGTQTISQWLSFPDFSLGWILLIVTLLTALRAGSQHAQLVLSSKLQLDLTNDFRMRCFGGILDAEWKWLTERKSADHAALIITNIGRIGTGLGQAMALVAAVASLVACLATAFVLSWQMTAVALVGGLVLLLTFRRRRPVVAQIGQDLGLANRIVQNQIQDGLTGIRQTKILQAEPQHFQRMASALQSLRDKQVELVDTISANSAILQTAAAVFVSLIVYASIMWLYLPYAIVLPMVVVFARMAPSLGAIQNSYHQWLHAVPAFNETRQFLAETEAEKERQYEALRKPMPLDDCLELVEASFRYNSRPTRALDKVSLTIPARKTTIITGASGAGKSSLADMLMGLILPDKGEMRIDGCAITPASRHDWRASVAYVQQDAFLFNHSIRNNLLWSRSESSDAELRKALSDASADFVHALPDGIDTIVGDGGVRLSGGERQRIALARALLRKPSLLILDEATSALDPANEASIAQAIAKLQNNLTIVIIGHRSAMVDEIDCHIELRNGRVVHYSSKNVEDPSRELIG